MLVLWLLALFGGCIAASKDYYHGKVVLLKDTNYRRAMIDF
jgi:hypothetical protein